MQYKKHLSNHKSKPQRRNFITLGKMRHSNSKMLFHGLSISFSTLSLMFLLFSSFFMCQGVAVSTLKVNQDSSSSISDAIPLNEPIKIKLLAPNTVSRKHTRTRQNSRFLRTFPPVELLNMARESYMTNEIEPMMEYNNHDYRNSMRYEGNHNNYNNYQSPNTFWPSTKARIDAAGNSPIFYIKLPPVPYVFMPGVGYVSPHPYSNAPSMPLEAMGQGMMAPNFVIPSGQDSSSSSLEQSVISLPLKFLSNGRPHQISKESLKKKKRPGTGIKENSSESKQGASLISGGKYSFNGRPTAVFVVRSPAGGK